MIDDLIIKSLQGRGTADEMERIAAWRHASAENEARYQDLRWVWSVTEGDEVLASPAPTADVVLAASRSPGGDLAGSTRHSLGAPARDVDIGARTVALRPRPRLDWRLAGMLAACVAAISLAGALVLQNRAPDQLLNREIVSGDQEGVTIALSDGSSVRLGPNSRLRLQSAAEADGERAVWLEGRAFFGIHHDPSRPFTVRTPHGDAIALGTRFEVRTHDDALEVVVVEGRVAMRDEESSITVEPGEMGRAAPGQVLTKLPIGDVFSRLDWLPNVLVFQETPLRSVVLELGRRYGREVRIDTPELGDMTVTSSFTDRPLDEVIDVLCQVVAADCSQAADGVVHMRSPQSEPESGSRP